MEEISIQIQQLRQFSRLSRVIHLVDVAVSSRIRCMPFRLACIRLVNLIYSLVNYETLTLMSMHC